MVVSLRAIRTISQTAASRKVTQSLISNTLYCSQATKTWGRAHFSTKYTTDHEYITITGNEGKIGITDFAQNQLGDVVYVDLPDVGATFEKGEIFGAVESVKAASDVYMPVSGEIIAVNEDLAEDPHLVNDYPLEAGWFVKVKLSKEEEIKELLDEAAYKEVCAKEEH